MHCANVMESRDVAAELIPGHVGGLRFCEEVMLGEQEG